MIGIIEAIDLISMFTIIIFVLVVLALCYFFYLRRKREAAAFREASFADFVEFDQDRSGSKSDNSAVNEIAAGVISAAAAAIEQRNITPQAEVLVDSGAYQARDLLFDSVTRSLLTNLYQAIGVDYLVLLKVPVSDLLSQNGNQVGQAGLAGLEKVDFVICQRNDLRAVCCIQHSGGGAENLSRIFRDTGLPFLRLAVGVSYSDAELRDLLKDFISPVQPVGQCSSCHGTMVIKRVSSGKNEGQYFWVCSACKLNTPVR